MRKLCVSSLIALAVAAGVPTAAHAEPPKFGIKAGWLYTNLNGDLASLDRVSLSTSAKSSFSGGGFALFELGGGFAIQPEVLFSRRVAAINASVDLDHLPEIPGLPGGPGFNRPLRLDSELQVDYLEIPILARYAFGSGTTRPFLYAGPEIAFKLSAQGSGGRRGDATFRRDIGDSVKATQFGLVFGGGSEFAIGHHRLILDARYTLGLTDVLDRSSRPGRPEFGGARDFGDFDRVPDLGLSSLKYGAFAVMIGYVF